MVLKDEHLGFLVIATAHQGVSPCLVVVALIYKILRVKVVYVLRHHHVHAGEHVFVDDSLKVVDVIRGGCLHNIVLLTIWIEFKTFCHGEVWICATPTHLLVSLLRLCVNLVSVELHHLSSLHPVQRLKNLR